MNPLEKSTAIKNITPDNMEFTIDGRQITLSNPRVDAKGCYCADIVVKQGNKELWKHDIQVVNCPQYVVDPNGPIELGNKLRVNRRTKKKERTPSRKVREDPKAVIKEVIADIVRGKFG